MTSGIVNDWKRCFCCMNKGDDRLKLVFSKRIVTKYRTEVTEYFCQAHTAGAPAEVEPPPIDEEMPSFEELKAMLLKAIAALDAQNIKYTATTARAKSCLRWKHFDTYPQLKNIAMKAAFQSRERETLARLERAIDLLKGERRLTMKQILKAAGVNQDSFQESQAARRMVENAVWRSGGYVQSRRGDRCKPQGVA